MVDELLRDLVARIEALEARTSGPTSSPPDDPGDDFWALHALEQRLEGVPAGGVVFAGKVAAGGGAYEWQLGRTTEAVTEQATDAAEVTAERLAALGSPIRLRLLLAVLHGATSTADLAELPELSTTGQVYHHLRALTAAGWLRSAGRGHVSVPPERVVPLITILAAALG